MIKVIQLSPIPTIFRLLDGRSFVFKGNGETDCFEDKDFKAIMKEYGSYIEPRIKNDKNPNGCFIVKEEAKKLPEVEEVKEPELVEEEVIPEPEEKKEEAPEVIKEKPIQRKKRVQKKKGK